MRVLLVEDDSELAREVAAGLHGGGISAMHARTAREARRLMELESPDVIVLDVMLPGESGFAMCKAVRDQGVDTPSLMLTARDAGDDRLTWPDARADDHRTR